MHSQLLLGAPAPRHPFRRSLMQPQVARAARSDDSDLKLFVVSYTAFFVCIYSFIF